ncbi:19808_t:CDS:1, partial [Racocetra fulgida]
KTILIITISRLTLNLQALFHIPAIQRPKNLQEKEFVISYSKKKKKLS